MIWALIWLAAGFGVLWLAQLALEFLSLPPLPRLVRRTPPGPRVPHWARTGHLPLPPSSPSAAASRHRRKATR